MPVNPSPGPSTPITNSNIVDRTRKFFVPSIGGWNTTDSIVLVMERLSKGWIMVDNKVCDAFGFFTCPEYFVSGMTATSVVVGEGTGNCHNNTSANYGTDGEDYNAHSDATGAAFTAIVSGKLEYLPALTLASMAKGDVVRLALAHDGTSGGDTVNAAVQILGWIIECTADM